MNIKVPKDISDVFETFLQMSGQQFSIERRGSIIAAYSGLVNSSETIGDYIGFRPDVDIQIGDWLINAANERFYVTDRKTNFISGKPNELIVLYDTEAEHERKQESNARTVFNISNASGSVIGNQNSVSLTYSESISEIKDKVDSIESPDKAELQKIVTLLEMLVNNEIPASKGIFSKFSQVMERNSWITNAIAGAVMSWLTSRV